MHSFDDKISEFAKTVEKSFGSLTLKSVAFAMPKEKGEVLKIKGTPKKYPIPLSFSLSISAPRAECARRI